MSRWGLGRIAVVGMVGAGALILGGGVWALVAWTGESNERQSDLPEELRLATLQKNAQESPEKLAETMMNTFDREDLTEEQRRQVRQNMREIRRAETEKRVEEYFAAKEQEKQAVLDRHIDEMLENLEKMRESFEKRRQQWEEQRRERGESKDDEAARQERRRRMIGTAQERKARSEGRDPDSMARQVAYREAVRNRMQERGLEMPRGPGFRGGPGRGGGPGGGRPGGGRR